MRDGIIGNVLMCIDNDHARRTFHTGKQTTNIVRRRRKKPKKPVDYALAGANGCQWNHNSATRNATSMPTPSTSHGCQNSTSSSNEAALATTVRGSHHACGTMNAAAASPASTQAITVTIPSTVPSVRTVDSSRPTPVISHDLPRLNG